MLSSSRMPLLANFPGYDEDSLIISRANIYKASLTHYRRNMKKTELRVDKLFSLYYRQSKENKLRNINVPRAILDKAINLNYKII